MDAWVKKQTKERKKQPNEGMNVERIANIYLLTLTPIERRSDKFILADSSTDQGHEYPEESLFTPSLNFFLLNYI